MNNSDGKMTLGVCILIGSFLAPTALYAKESKIAVPVIKPVDIKTEGIGSIVHDIMGSHKSEHMK